MNNYVWELEIEKLAPPKYEWICVGEYNGIDIPDIQVGGLYTDFDDINSPAIIAADYMVWQRLPNPEYNCEVIID